MTKRYITKISLIVVVALTLQGCFVAKDYERPPIESVSEALFRTDNLPQDSTSMADVSWKSLFTDAALVVHIETGLANNLDIRMALQQIEAANAYYRQGKAGYLPTFGVNAQVTHQELSKNSQFGAFFNGGITQYDLSGNLSWEADIWGKIRSNKRASAASYLQSVSAHQAVKTQLVASIATLYYQLATLDEQLRIVEETIKNRTTSLETTQALKQAGLLTEVAVKQTEAQLYNAQALQLDLKRDIALTENTFSILLGASPQQIERNTLDVQELNADLKTGYPAQLLRNRPDVMAAEYGLVNAFEMTNVARSQFYPSLSISATSGFQSLELDQWLSGNSIFANFVGSLAQPILNGRRIKTQYEVAQAQQEQAFLQFKKAMLTASKEVSDAMYNYTNAEAKIAIKTKEFEAYSDATTYSEDLLDNGLANYLEVLRSRENSLNAQVSVTNAQFEKLQAIVELYRALGGGWK